MCGIAGYNVSEEWKAEFITPEVQKAVLREAWLHNLHRGKDAAGYFALREDGNYKVYKKNNDAETLINKNLKRSTIPATRVFGAHTRAMTKGDAKVAANNHPVYYDGIWVTHNGTIRNDEEIKKTVEGTANLAEVDSIAIPIRLSSVVEPVDVQSVVNAVSELKGGYAFHAVWREHPGLSALVRGESSPLMIAMHRFGGIFYASEVEALWGMIGAMNLDPATDEWEYYSMRDYSALIVENGAPVAWADYESVGSTKEIVSRILPTGKDDKLQIVYTSKDGNDFAQKHGAAGRDLSQVAETELVYTLEEGATKVTDRYPRGSYTDVLSSVSEADKIVYNKASGNRHVFFGDVELIMAGRVVMDVYDHSKFTTDQRWFVDPVIEERLETVDDFLKKKSTMILQTPNSQVPYKYDRKADVIPLGRLPGTNRGGGRQLTSKTEGLQLIKPNPILTWNNIWNLVQDHNDLQKGKDGFVFQGQNLRCSAHGDVLMQDHPNPEHCGYAKASAAYMLSCAPDLEILTALMPSAKIHEYSASKPCPMGKHDIQPTIYFEIILASERYFEILIEEECMDCGTQWKLDDIPFWLLGIIGGRKDMLVGYNANR